MGDEEAREMKRQGGKPMGDEEEREIKRRGGESER